MTAGEPVARPKTVSRALSLRARVLVGLAAIAMVAIAAALAVTLTTQSYLVSQVDDRLLAITGP